jgi:polyisoprenoid-binding protein YceI
MTPGSTTPAKRRLNRKVVIAIVVVAIIAVAGGGFGLWYILVGPSGPASVNAGAPVIPATANVAAPASIDGTWTVNDTLGTIDDGSASFVGYRVREQLVGVGGHTAVGRTTKVTGTMNLSGATVSSVSITADLTALQSDDSLRDDQLKTQAIDTNQFPDATFKTTAPINLGSLPADGTTVSVTAQGQLTIHGVTKSVQIPLQAIRKGGIIAIAGSLPIVFADYGFAGPNSFSVLSVDDHGTMELHLLFTASGS